VASIVATRGKDVVGIAAIVAQPAAVGGSDRARRRGLNPDHRLDWGLNVGPEQPSEARGYRPYRNRTGPVSDYLPQVAKGYFYRLEGGWKVTAAFIAGNRVHERSQ
jgi:hypothetical protein